MKKSFKGGIKGMIGVVPVLCSILFQAQAFGDRVCASSDAQLNRFGCHASPSSFPECGTLVRRLRPTAGSILSLNCRSIPPCRTRFTGEASTQICGASAGQAPAASAPNPPAAAAAANSNLTNAQRRASETRRCIVQAERDNVKYCIVATALNNQCEQNKSLSLVAGDGICVGPHGQGWDIRAPQQGINDLDCERLTHAVASQCARVATLDSRTFLAGLTQKNQGRSDPLLLDAGHTVLFKARDRTCWVKRVTAQQSCPAYYSRSVSIQNHFHYCVRWANVNPTDAQDCRRIDPAICPGCHEGQTAPGPEEGP